MPGSPVPRKGGCSCDGGGTGGLVWKYTSIAWVYQFVSDQEGRDMALLVTSLALIILDPDARTLHGFEALIEREWIQTGHPFWTR